jgi:hypothetical protein
VKGDTNALTDVLERALEIAEDLDTKLAASFGIPLYTESPGRSSELRWPEDPDQMPPEEMAVLVATRGEDAVNRWLREHYEAQLQRETFPEAFEPEHKGGVSLHENSTRRGPPAPPRY